MTTKQYNNSYKDMHPTVAQHIGREIVLATMNGSNAADLNERLRASGTTNPDNTAVIFTESHLSQMATGIIAVLTEVQDKAPHRFSEALNLVINMHTGGSYGPWYRKWYIPHALKNGAPMWVPAASARKIVTELKQRATDTAGPIDIVNGFPA